MCVCVLMEGLMMILDVNSEINNEKWKILRIKGGEEKVLKEREKINK